MSDISEDREGGSMTDFNLGEFLKCVRQERMTYGEFRWQHIRVLADEIERLRKRVEELEEADRQWDKTGLVEIIKERDQFKKRIAELERQVAEWQARAVSMFRFVPGDTLWGDIQAVRNAYLAWKTGDGHE